MRGVSAMLLLFITLTPAWSDPAGTSANAGGSVTAQAGGGAAQNGGQTATGAVVTPTVTRHGSPATDVQLSAEQVAAGEQLVLSFIVHNVDAENSEVVEPAYPDILARSGGPVIRTVFVSDTPSSPQIRSAQVEITFTGVHPGRATMPPIGLQEGHTIHETPPVVVAVADAKTGLVPPSLKWSVSPDTPYQGQTVYIQLEVYNVLAPSFPDRVTVSPPAGGVFEEVNGLGKIRTTTVGTTQLYQFPAATYFLTATGEGSVTLPPAGVSLQGAAAQAPALDITVLPVPPEVQKSGAVGDFSFTASVDRTEIDEGDALLLTIRLEGVGNLDYFKFPEIDPGKLVVTGTEERSKYVATELGYTGYREETVTLAPRSSGDTTVVVPAFAWVEPQTHTVRRAAAQRFSVNVNPAPISAPNNPTAGTAEFTLLSVDQIRAATPANAFRNPLSYLWLLPGILVLAARIMFRRKLALLPFFGAIVVLLGASSSASFPATQIAAGNEAFASGNINAAIASFDAALARSPENPGILYNEALCYFQLHDNGKALYRALAAVRLEPGDVRFREAAAWMQSQLSLTRQVEPPRAIHPDLALMLTFAFFNVTCLLGALSGRKRTGLYVIVMSFAVLLAASSGVLTGVMAHIRSTEIGVVGPQSGELLKIPRGNATSWLELPPGTSVTVRLEANGFYLIRTGFGVEGWLPTDSVDYGTLGQEIRRGAPPAGDVETGKS